MAMDETPQVTPALPRRTPRAVRRAYARGSASKNPKRQRAALVIIKRRLERNDNGNNS